MFLNQVAQGPRRYPEEATGASPIALALLEGAPDQVRFDGAQVVVEAEALRERLVGGRGRRGGRHLLRQALGQDRAARLEGDRALDDVLQLPHVPRPGVLGEAAHRLAGDLRYRLVHLAAESDEEVLGEEGDVLLPRAQWRHLDGDHVEAIEE